MKFVLSIIMIQTLRSNQATCRFRMENYANTDQHKSFTSPPPMEQKLKFSGLCSDLLSLSMVPILKRQCDGSINCAALWNFQLFEPIIRRFLSFSKLLSVAHFIVYYFARRQSDFHHCNQKQEFLQFNSVFVTDWTLNRKWVMNIVKSAAPTRVLNAFYQEQSPLPARVHSTRRCEILQK